MKKIFFYLVFAIPISFNIYSAEMNIVIDKKLTKKHLENIKDVLVKLDQKVINPFIHVVMVKTSDNEYRFKFQKIIDENLFIIKPLNDFNVSTVCPGVCKYSLIKLNAKEEFEIYYRNKPLRRNDRQKIYDELFGDVKVRYGASGSVAINGKQFPFLYNYGLSVNKVLSKKVFKNIMFSFSGGLEFDFIKTNLGALKLSYINESLKEATMMNFSVPYTIHFMPFSFLSMYAGFNFNVTFLPISNEFVDDSSGKSLSRVTSLTGGISSGFHGGMSLIFKQYIIDVRFSSYSFTISEDEEYEVLNGEETVLRNKLTKFYDSSIQQIHIGVGITF